MLVIGGVSAGLPMPIPRAITTYRGVKCEMKVAALQLATIMPSISTSGKLTDLCQISEGDDFFNREGRSIFVDGIDIVGQLVGGQSNISADEQRNAVRLVVVEGSPQLTLSSFVTAWPLGQAADLRNLGGVSRVLCDELVYLNSPGRDTVGYMPASVVISKHINIKTTLYYTSNVATGISFKSLYIFALSDSSIAPNPGFVNGFINLHFVDTK